jgi:aconitate hydratase
MSETANSFGARARLRVGDRDYRIYRLDALEREGLPVAELPYSLRILLENLLRHEDGITVTADDVRAMAGWQPAAQPSREISFTPARVLLQDFTGVPAVVDLAAMRAAMAQLGGDPRKINPLQPVELVIDHSVQVDVFGNPRAMALNSELEYTRNRERYTFLRWGQQAFRNFRVVPPNTGICHQVNLEYLSRVVFSTDEMEDAAVPLAYPDTLVGTDSHTPMVNGLGVLGWGVGGIEAEAAMLGQAISLLIPQVVGVRLEGELAEAATATDLVLTVAELLRAHGVVGRFVEFFGPGLAALPLADRATIGNMTPEYGATCTMFPVDEETLRYLRFTGRSEERIALVEAYMKEQGLFHGPDSPEPRFTHVLTLDLATVEPSIAGPRRPQDRLPLSRAKAAFGEALPGLRPGARSTAAAKGAAIPSSSPAERVGVWGEGGDNGPEQDRPITDGDYVLADGGVVIAAITSCTNTSNPSVMVAAGLLARNAVRRGLRSRPWVKTSLAPGSQVVTRYLDAAGLTQALDELGFQNVGYGCTTCIGNSGPLPPTVSRTIDEQGLVVCSALSGNRNFEGRIHSEVRANYLMSPPLVVAYALAGRMDIDLYNEPLGHDPEGRSIFLRDIWPDQHEVQRTIEESVRSEMFTGSYASVFEGDEQWRSLDSPTGDLYEWDPDSTYVKQPPYFEGMARTAPADVKEIRGARVLAVLGDSITTDHISPAGSIRKDSPAGSYLRQLGVEAKDFNSYGSRRGNHEVMVRGTFANVRIRNRLVGDVEGGYTTHQPSGELLSIYDAALRYAASDTPLLVLAGKEYGSGSSRDWAAKGPFLQGVKGVIAESYERIHRSNLIGMGILPLQFLPEESVESLQLTGHEVYDVEGLQALYAQAFTGPREVTVRALREDGTEVSFRATVRIDTPQEAAYYRHGGILQFVLRQLLQGREGAEGMQAGVPAIAQADPAAPPTTHDVEEGSKESFPASDPPAY